MSLTIISLLPHSLTHSHYRYIELITEHPIVVMFLTPQYQGLARDKVFDKETLREVEVGVDIDYAQKTEV